MTESEISAAIDSQLSQADVQIVSSLLNGGMTLDQMPYALERIKFRRKWLDLESQITAPLPQLTADQLQALAAFVTSGQGYRGFLDDVAKEVLRIARSGDGPGTIKALLIFAATFYTLRPELTQ